MEKANFAGLLMKALVLQIVCRETGLNEVAPSTSLDDLGLDSLEFLDLIVKVSAETGVSIPQADYGTINTVNDLIRAVSK